MKNLLLTALHLAVTTAKLCGPVGVRAVIAANLLLKQQLIDLRTDIDRTIASDVEIRRGVRCRWDQNGIGHNVIVFQPKRAPPPEIS